MEAGQNGIGLEIPPWAGKPSPASAEELYIALREALKLQKHYAELLNMHDGGQRRSEVFATPETWIARLRDTGELPNIPLCVKTDSGEASA